jgi:hypothetical protein
MSLSVIPYAMDAYLGMLAGRSEGDELLEVRRRARTGGMACEFFPIDEREELSRCVLSHARTTDVYVGCAPRCRRAGSKDAIRNVWTLWAECDGAGSVEAIQRFAPAPALVIGSGTGSNCHAYWPLREPLSPKAAEVANLRLAVALGADLRCFDASRILRPPGTWNHKHRPPTRVATIRLDMDRRFDAERVLANAPAIDREIVERRWRPEPTSRHRDDPLLRIDPARYVRELLGRRPCGNHKIACPFHEDQRPSLHVFATPERGWCCFSCGRGGTIYDLAAALWGMTPRGREFIQLRRLLQERFAGEIDRDRRLFFVERA